MRSAGSICLDELRVLREGQADRLQGTSAPSSGSIPRSSSRTASSGSGTVDQLRQLLLKEESKQPTQQEERLLRQCLPETWSLLSGLARGSDLPPAQVSQFVYSFLHVTTTETIIYFFGSLSTCAHVTRLRNYMIAESQYPWRQATLNPIKSTVISNFEVWTPWAQVVLRQAFATSHNTTIFFSP